MNLHLKIKRVGDCQAGINRCRHGSPVFVDLETQTAVLDLLDHRVGLMGVAAPQEPEIHRPMLGGLQHFTGVEHAATINPDCDRPQGPAQHRRDT